MRKYTTTTSTITSKYQTVIPASVRKRLDLSKNSELIWQVVPQDDHLMIVVLPKPKDWGAYMSGLGKEIWKGVNTESYIKELRKEWQA